MRFVIVDELPFLLADGKTYACRMDGDTITIGTEVNLASVPEVTHSDIAVLAKCRNCDSISAYGTKAAGTAKKGRKKNDSDG